MQLSSWLAAVHDRLTNTKKRRLNRPKYRSTGNFAAIVEHLEHRRVLSGISTTSIVSASSSKPIVGQSETFTATVSSASGTPNAGTVTFYDGSTTLGTGAVSNGTATLTTATLATGVHVVTVAYSGSGSYLGSSSQLEPSSIIQTVAGNGTAGFSGNNGPATSAEIKGPGGIAFDASGNLFFSDSQNNMIREVNATTHQITTVVGNGNDGYSGDNGLATAATLNLPTAIAFDASGDLFIAANGNPATFGGPIIREVNATTHVITTVVGNGTSGNNNPVGDGGPATAAELSDISDITIDKSGDLFCVDAYRVREVNAVTHIITTIAGNGNFGVLSGDNGPATAAAIGLPVGIALDAAGDLFITDGLYNVVRKVNAQTQVITTIAGIDSTKGSYSGDNGPATSAGLDQPAGIALDAAGDIFIADTQNNVIREINAATGIITTFAGNGYGAETPNGEFGGGNGGYSGDSGAASSAELNYPFHVAVDSTGNLFIADAENSAIREVVNGVSVTVSTLKPEVISLVPTSANPGSGSTATFAVTFSEAVTGLIASDFTLASNGITGGSIALSGSGASYTLTVTGLSGSGSLGVNLPSSSLSSVVDANGIPVGSGYTGNVVTLLQPGGPASLSGTTLTINGTEGRNFTTIGEETSLEVSINGLNLFFNPSAVTAIIEMAPVGNDTTVVKSLNSNTTFKSTLGSGDDAVYVSTIVSSPVTLIGGTGNDTLTSGNGNDLLIGGSGNAEITDGNGNDRIYGGNADSFMTAGNGNDTFYAGTGNNVYLAGNGNDVFYGGTENNFISAGSGTNKFLMSVPTISNATDTLKATGSTNTLNLTTFTDGLTFSLAVGFTYGTAQTADASNGFQFDIQSNVFNIVDLGGNAGTTNIVTGNTRLGTKIVGGNGNNTITGGAGNDFLMGGIGNSLLTDGNGNDTLYGGNANSTLTAGNGNDMLVGGLGDTSMSAGNGNDKLIGGNGNNTQVAGNGADTFYTGLASNVVSGGTGLDKFNISVPTSLNSKDTLASTGQSNTLNLTAFTDGLTFSLAVGSGTAQTADSSNSFQLDVANNAFNIVDLGGNSGTTNVITGNTTLGTRIIGGNGNNTITGGAGNDFLIGGIGNSLLTDGNGNDTLYGGNASSTLISGSGNDAFVGGLGNTTMSAGNGNDKLTGGTGTNSMIAGNGNDTLIGGNANNTMTAGNGNDSFYGGYASNVISSGTGVNKFFLAAPTVANSKDALSSAGSTNTLNLTAFTDGLTFSLAVGNGTAQTADSSNGFQLVIANNAFNIVDLGGNAGTTNVVAGNTTLGTRIVGGNGNNTITSGAGNDFLIGGVGNTLITDGNGNDTLYGGNASSTLIAGNGNDSFVGGLGNTTMSAGNGNDKLTGGTGTNSIVAGNGNDLLIGGNANNTLTAGNGNDSLYGGYANNVISSGTGVNKFFLAAPTVANSKDTLSSTGSTNTLNMTAFTDGLTFSLAVGSGTAQTADSSNGFQLDVANNAFNIVDLGGNAGTTNLFTGNTTLGTRIVGGNGNNTITSGAGNDFIIGGIGNTLITDGNGNDTLYGGNASSTLIAGNGNDTFVGGLGNTTMSAGNGNDKLTGGTGTNSIVAGNGNDTLIGGNANNTMTAGNGNDTLYGGYANNVMSVGTGVNKFFLVAPTVANSKDTLSSTGSTNTLNLTAFTDGLTFSLGKGSGVAQTADSSNGFQLDVANNAFNIVDLGGNAGTTNLFTGNTTLGTRIVGGNGNNTIAGGAGNDFIIGGIGNTLITDGNGNDTLYGGNASSTLIAANGNDTFVGGLGNTTMSAGNGNDKLTGGTGTNSIVAGNGNDTLIGGNANNTLVAGNGNDSLYGGYANNVMSAGTGVNKFFLVAPTVANAKDTLSSSGSTNTLNMTAFSDGLTFSLAVGSGVAQTADPTTGFQLDIASNAFNIVDLGGNAGTTNILIGNTTVTNRLVGSGVGNNVLEGGSGNSTLIGGAGKDILIGGSGTDSLIAGTGGQAILIGGSVSFANSLSALIAIESEWASTDSYTTRVARLLGPGVAATANSPAGQAGGSNGTTYLNSTTVTLGIPKDSLIGGGANDWFWASSLDTTNRQTGEDLN